MWLEAHAGAAPAPLGDHDRVLRERGREHEGRVASRFPGLVGPIHRRGRPLAESAAETRTRLVPGGPPLWQPAFLSGDGRRAGIPDFLYWERDGAVLADAKLALRAHSRGDVVLQLTHYATLFEEATGRPPLRCEVVNGNGETVVVKPLAPEVYARRAAQAEALLGDAPEPGILKSHSECRKCPFYDHCWDAAERARRVEALPELSRDHVPVLHALGVRTVDDLARLSPDALARTPLAGRAPRLIAQARAHATGVPVWTGVPALPRGRTCVWFDLEGDSMGEGSAVPIYLWGLAVESAAGAEPEAMLADFEPGADERGWSRFLARWGEILEAHPDALIVHWHQYELTWVERYLRTYGAPEPQASALRDRRRWFDLHGAVDRWVRLPLRSYSIKFVAPWMGFRWRNPESGSEWSVAQYHRARESRDPAERERLLAAVAEYNADDLLAMRAIWRWLEREGDAGTR